MNYLSMRAGPNHFFGAGVPAELIEKVRFFLFMIQALTGFIGALCIVVGGIGIMNIMMVTVTERVREIGIMKSQGASPQQIRSLFITECIALCFVAGFAGIAVGLFVTNFVSLSVALFFPKSGLFEFIVPFWGLILGVVVSFSSGIGFGFFPALKASRMEPAACMREDS
jgi:ABC-type antimicrobial peptide transport system permease subunit